MRNLNDSSTEDGAPPFEVAVDRTRRCLRITMRGLWTHDIFDAFAAELRAAEAVMKGFDGTTYAIADGRTFEMQDLAIVERFLPLLESFGLDGRRRSAVVAPGPLARMQARPAGDVVNARHFRTLEDATDWLFSDEA